jgi:hypothetical protein
MNEPRAFDRWVQRWGWRIILVLLVISALARAWQMWAGRGG